MSIKVVDFKLPASAPVDDGMVRSLRYIADQVEAGNIRHVCVVSLTEGEAYREAMSCSPGEGVILAALLQRAAVDRLCSE